MLKKITLLTLLTGVSLSASYAQDSTVVASSKPTITGYGDVYYRYNFNNPQRNQDGELFPNNLTSFTNSHNSFELNMISLKIEHTIGKVGIVGDVGFGTRAEEFSYNDENSKLLIKQLYVTYSPTDNLKFSAGSWGTHIGYEVVDPTGNRNYSMSYMFTNGPFFHTGLKADLTLGKIGLMAGIANPTDLKSTTFDQKTFIAQLSAAPSDKFKAYLNFQGGEQDENTKLNQFDLVLTGIVSDKFSLGYNGTISNNKFRDNNGNYGDSQNWFGSALYLNVDPSPGFGLTLRGDYFDDSDALKMFSGVDGGGNVFAGTLSGNIRINNLTIIPELRIDNGSKELFRKYNGTASKSTFSSLIAVVYKF